MPGHSLAALAAYPELSCTGGPFEVQKSWGVFPDVYCAGKEETFEFLTGVLDEVLELFPSEFIHIGGDECPKDRWKECPDCQKRIRDEGLADEHELQSWFVKRMERYLSQNGRRLIGWDEILEGGIAPGATVMSWRGVKGGIEAADTGHDVVMAPNTYTYFDYYQVDKDRQDKEPLGIGGYLPLEKVYSFEPVPDEIDTGKEKHILGAQGQLWGEYIPNPKHAEYMAFPRACALAEVVWTEADKKDYEGFLKRLEAHLKRLGAMDVNYRPDIHL
jgi:hexosaminidase